MKIVQLGPFPPPHGGVQSNLVAIRDYVRGQGHTCAVINLTRFRREERDEVFYPRTPWGVIGLLLRGRYDIIHLHIGGDLPLRLVLLAFVCALIPRARAVFTFHSGGYPSSGEGRRARPFSLRGLVFRRIDFVIAVNDELLTMFRRFGVSPKRLAMIPPHATLGGKRGKFEGVLADFFASHDPVLVSVSGLEPEYDIPLQMEALGRIVERFPRLGLAVLGGGSQEKQIRAQAASVRCSDHLLISGDVSHAITLQAIAQAAALLRTTWYDGDSIAVREALALGTPVIATDNGMRPAGVHLIPMRDSTALVHAVEEVLAAPRPSAVNEDDRNLRSILAIYEQLFRPI